MSSGPLSTFGTNLFPSLQEIYDECARIARAEGIKQQPETPHVCNRNSCVIRMVFGDIFLCVRQSKIAHICVRDEQSCRLYSDSNGKFRCYFSDSEVAVVNLSSEEKNCLHRASIAKRRSEFSIAFNRTLSPQRNEWTEYETKGMAVWKTLMYSDKRDSVDAVRLALVCRNHNFTVIRAKNTLFRNASRAAAKASRAAAGQSPEVNTGGDDRKRTALDAFSGMPDDAAINVDAFLDVVISTVNDARMYVLTNKATRQERDYKYNVAEVVLKESFRYFAVVQSAIRGSKAHTPIAAADKFDKQYTVQDHLIAWCYERDKILVHTECVLESYDFPLGLDMMMPHPNDLASLSIPASHGRNRRLRDSLKLCGVQSIADTMNCTSNL